MRLAKYISRSGVCSRRKAEELIFAGHVLVDNIVARDPALDIDTKNSIKVNNIKITSVHPRLWKYHKPSGLITSHYDPYFQNTVFNNLPKNLPHVISVGRLDLNSSGLLLLTNSPSLAHILEVPKDSLERNYLVRSYGTLSRQQILQAARGLKINNVSYKSVSITYHKSSGRNFWYKVVLTEGKNREIRKIFQYFNCSVNRLIRISFGDFLLGDLKIGQVEEIPYELYEHYMPKEGLV